MKKIIRSGYVLADIVEDEYEGHKYKRLDLKISDRTTESIKLKAPASYELLEMVFMQQAKNNKE